MTPRTKMIRILEANPGVTRFNAACKYGDVDEGYEIIRGLITDGTVIASKKFNPTLKIL